MPRCSHSFATPRMEDFQYDWVNDLRQEIEDQRAKAVYQFDRLIAEAWWNLDRESKRIVLCYQQMTGRPDPTIRPLFQLDEQEQRKLNSLSNAHLFSSHLHCCRNLSLELVQTLNSPSFLSIRIDPGIVLCFDAATQLEWFYQYNELMAVAHVPVQLGPDSFTEIVVPLTLEEVEFYAQFSPYQASEGSKRKSDGDSPASPSQKMKYEETLEDLRNWRVS